MVATLDMAPLLERDLVTAVATEASFEDENVVALREIYDKVVKALAEIEAMDLDVEWLPAPNAKARRMREFRNRAAVESLDRLREHIMGDQMGYFSAVVKESLGPSWSRRLESLRKKAASNALRVADQAASLLAGIRAERVERASFKLPHVPPGKHRGSVAFEL